MLRRVPFRANLLLEWVPIAHLFFGREEDPTCACASGSTGARGDGPRSSSGAGFQRRVAQDASHPDGELVGAAIGERVVVGRVVDVG